MYLHARLPLEPIGEPRAGRRVVVPKGGGRPFVMAYQPPEARRWREDAIVLLRQVYRGPPLEEALYVKVTATFTMPKSEHRKREPRPGRWHVGKPDPDNVLKAVLDTLQEAGWIADDKTVAVVSFAKAVAPQGGEPSVEIEVCPLVPLR